jgi:TRAP-type transport system periplasmic protein
MLHRFLGPLIAACTVFATLGANPAVAQKQTLHMAYWAGPSHQMVQTLASWIKTIEEASGANTI